MAKLPAFLLYTGDWLKDPKLTLCSPATRGIFMDLLCAMHESDRSGQISGTREQLARVARCTAVDIGHAIDELKSTNAAEVTERNKIVTVRNRRMWREYKLREHGRLRVERHREKRGCNAEEIPHIHSSSSVSVSKTSIIRQVFGRVNMDDGGWRVIEKKIKTPAEAMFLVELSAGKRTPAGWIIDYVRGDEYRPPSTISQANMKRWVNDLGLIASICGHPVKDRISVSNGWILVGKAQIPNGELSPDKIEFKQETE